ncbi:ABC transporter substrate-binding protein [Amycolatopsis sp. cg5]|uniref:ABC transporter substrate-binding protein n=1 Tax=Amycolatopsis sp. cg5 TaxID=3238802 RepID=UPI0035259A61
MKTISPAVAALLALFTLSACSSGDKPAAAQCRDVQHELGSACVPASPQRVVVLDPSTTLPTLLDLGVPVAGAMGTFANKAYPSYLDAAKAGTQVGVSGAVDVEKIAALKPDLIIGWKTEIEPLQDKLKPLAPTVALPYAIYDGNWRPVVQKIGDVVGARAKIDEQLAALDRKQAEVKAAVAPTGEGPTVTRVDGYRGQTVTYQWDCSWFGDVLKGAGLRQPPAQKAACTNSDVRSVVAMIPAEGFAKLDADSILVYQQSVEATAVDPIAALAANPLWAGLGAVKAGKVRTVGDAWGVGAGIKAANLILDDIKQFFPPKP